MLNDWYLPQAMQLWHQLPVVAVAGHNLADGTLHPALRLFGGCTEAGEGPGGTPLDVANGPVPCGTQRLVTS